MNTGTDKFEAVMLCDVPVRDGVAPPSVDVVLFENSIIHTHTHAHTRAHSLACA